MAVIKKVCDFRIANFCLLMIFGVVESVVSSKLYGPYIVSMTNMTMCPNTPIPSYKVKINWTKSDGLDKVILEADFPKAIGPIGGTVTVMRWNINKYGNSLNFKTNKICDAFIASVDSSIWPKLDSRCYLTKGHHMMNITDGNKVAHVFSGNTMLYGKYKTRIYIKYGRHFLGCREIYAEMMPI